MTLAETTAVELPIDISVVLPCLNEEAAIASVIEEAWKGIEATGLRGEVIVVDNGSTDNSSRIAHERGARVVHEGHRGYGSAYLAGLVEARGDYIVMADADGTYDLTKLHEFIDSLERGNDMVIGSRFRGEIHPRAMPWTHRWIGNPALTALLNVLFDVHVSDAHCGLRGLRRSALPLLHLQAMGMEFASEMILKARKSGLRIDEIPIEYRPRKGRSKLSSLRDGWRHLRLMLVYSSSNLFLIPGLFLTILGLAALLPLSAGPIEAFGTRWGIVTMVVGAAATLVGAQVIQLGVFSRSYGVLYLGEHEPWLERLWLRIRLEHGLLLGATLFMGGLALLIVIGIDHVQGGPVTSRDSYTGLLGLTLIGLGVQTTFGSFFLSILGLRKHLLFKRVTVAAEATAPEEELVAAQQL